MELTGLKHHPDAYKHQVHRAKFEIMHWSPNQENVIHIIIIKKENCNNLQSRMCDTYNYYKGETFNTFQENIPPLSFCHYSQEPRYMDLVHLSHVY